MRLHWFHAVTRQRSGSRGKPVRREQGALYLRKENSYGKKDNA